MKGEIPLKGGDEYDGLTGWRKTIYWKPGERKMIKRGYHRRERRVGKQQAMKRAGEES